MKIGYAPRATRDLLEIGSYYRTVAGARTAIAVARRMQHVVSLLAQQPFIAPRVAGREDVRVALVLPYPFKVFYRVRGDEVQILHVRHSARRPWSLASRD